MQKLKVQVIERLNLKDLKPSDIGDDQPLFVEGIGLDSIDALELIVLLQQEYNIKLSNAEDGPRVFHSIRTMADYITASPPRRANEPVLIPGDPERANRAKRLKDGVPIDDETWREIALAARGVNVLIEPAVASG